jgi:2-succinyl-5-enolpyruvyl-6-hydroxy-3-cyclohexene-1-carboxylate synthase
MNNEQAIYLYVGVFLDELARSGVKQVVVCPGSRSTAIALMLAEEPRFKLWLHLDERSAAFFALGMAKSLRAPVALLCTSGTAAANFFPAIVEAHASHVPLIVLTADRPPELRDTGAPQTIDQIKLYGEYAKWFVEMALPEGAPEALRYARTIACRAVATAQAVPSGVVHLNFPFREPLVPAAVSVTFEEKDRVAYEGRTDGLPYLQNIAATQTLDVERLTRLATDLVKTERGLIVAGPQTDSALAEVLTKLSVALGYPLLADPLSQVRCGGQAGANVIDAYDAFLRDASVVAKLVPEVILSFDAISTSKPVLQYLQRHANARQILIGGEWNDPNRLASEAYLVPSVQFCEALLNVMDREIASPSPWLKQWQAIQRESRKAVSEQLKATEEFFEGRVFAELAAGLSEGATLWASSSMPVRDMDTFVPASERKIRFLSNRGANGIDGVISSALGAGAVSDGRLVLVIGDIAFYHDMNGLLAAKLHKLNATIVLLNNDGGGIFSFLPQAAHPKHFEELFGTPHGLNFEPVAGIYEATYVRPKDWTEFRVAIQDNQLGLKIVEVRTDRDRNVTLHRAVWPKVSEAVRDL